MTDTTKRRPFRVIDTGLRGGRANIAFDQALIDARLDDAIPDTIRFLRFTPSALVGRHQDLSKEIKVDHCRGEGIELVRRITGGGAIFFDEGQLGWELVFKRAHLPFTNLGEAASEICRAAAAGLQKLGVDAKYRPRNDIEVDGRKICGTGGFFEGDVLFYQGTLLITVDPARMMAALNVPEAKLKKRRLDDPAQRVTTLSVLLGDALPDLADIQAALVAGFAENLGLMCAPGEVSAREEELARARFHEEIGRESYVFGIDAPDRVGEMHAGSHTGAGGTVTAYVRLEGPGSDRLREVLFTGDFFITPPRSVFDLESGLRGVKIDDAPDAIERFFETAKIDAITLRPADFIQALAQAVEA